jgi:hypothetical protein
MSGTGTEAGTQAKWEAYQKQSIVEEAESDKIQIAIGRIVNQTTSLVKAVVGEAVSLINFGQQVSIGLGNSIQTDNETIEMFEHINNSVYVLLRFKTNTVVTSHSIWDYLGYSRKKTMITLYIEILKPGNEVAQIQCDTILNRNIQSRVDQIIT